MADQTPSAADQAAAIRWFARQPRAIQVEAIQLQSALLRQDREEGAKGPVTSDRLLMLLARACLRMEHEENTLRMKARLTQEDARKIHERKLTRFKARKKQEKEKPSPKRDAIRLRYFAMVQELRRKEGFGWRNCAQFLKDQHHFTVSHAFLKQVIEELEAVQHGDRD
jgi:hypothetical protein